MYNYECKMMHDMFMQKCDDFFKDIFFGQVA